jgi:hypothetical protein
MNTKRGTKGRKEHAFKPRNHLKRRMVRKQLAYTVTLEHIQTKKGNFVSIELELDLSCFYFIFLEKMTPTPILNGQYV